MTRFALLTALGLITLATPGFAQTVSEGAPPVSCTIIEDAIIPLKPPTFGGPLAWRRVLGIEGIDRLTDLLPLADGGVVTIGETAYYTRDKGLQPLHLYVGRFDKFGKNVFENRIEVKNLVAIKHGLVLKDKILVLAELKDGEKPTSTALLYLDGAGRLKDTQVVADDRLDYVPADFIANPDGLTLTLGVTASRKDSGMGTYTILFRLSAAGKVLAKREFLPGVPNRLEDLQRGPNGQVIGSGRVKTEDGRDAGWLLRTSRQGDLILQRPYARGGQAQLLKSFDDGQGGLYTLGEAIPSSEGYRAAWIMHLDSAGEVIWQRFLSGKYSYRAIDGYLRQEGRLEIILSGHPIDDGGREHARILTLSTSGDILSDEAHVEGSNAVPVRLINHSVTDKRIMAGYVQTGLGAYGIPAGQKLITYDTWLAQLPSLNVYVDPCKPVQKETLDDYR